MDSIISATAEHSQALLPRGRPKGLSWDRPFASDVVAGSEYPIPMGDRRLGIAGVVGILFTVLAPASRAESSTTTEIPQQLASAVQIESLESDLSRPDSFGRYVEGSRLRSGDVAAPSLGGKRTAFDGGRSRLSLSSPLSELRPDGMKVPAAFVGGTPAAPNDPRSIPGLLMAGLVFAPILACGIAAGWSARREAIPETQTPQADGPSASVATRASRRIPAPARVEPSSLIFTQTPVLPLTVPEPESVDPQMPVATWRSISSREQKLLDQWDASREKAAGRASFEDWLDTLAVIDGVDVAALKAKLQRDV